MSNKGKAIQFQRLRISFFRFQFKEKQREREPLSLLEHSSDEIEKKGEN